MSERDDLFQRMREAAGDPEEAVRAVLLAIQEHLRADPYRHVADPDAVMDQLRGFAADHGIEAVLDYDP